MKLPEKKITDYEWRVQTKKDAKIYNGDVVIGQAYNKGNLVVLSSKEQSDALQEEMIWTFELFFYSFIAIVFSILHMDWRDHYKVDPRTIHIDQRKKDVLIEISGIHYKKTYPKSNKQISNANQFLCLHFFMSV